MTPPTRYLTRMVLFVIAVALLAALIYAPLLRAFESGPFINGLILLLLLFGIGLAFRQVIMLRREVDWIDSFRSGEQRLGAPLPPQPVLLAPIAAMLKERHGRMSLSTLSTRAVLDSISARLDESRELNRYLIGLLIFLGLLGTFWGLLQTIGAVGQTIGSLSPTEGDFAGFFSELQAGLEAPLSGMGIAFSSSLFGLSGSLVLGFLDLQTGQAQNRFYTDIEDWLAERTRLSSGGLMADGEHSVPAYMQALLEQTAESLENLQRIITRSEEGRGASQATLLQLAERLATLTDQMRAEQSLLVRLAESHLEIKPVLQRLTQAIEQNSQGLDEASRNHLRNLDVYVLRLLEELSDGRNQTVTELRSEIKLLARTIAALGEDR